MVMARRKDASRYFTLSLPEFLVEEKNMLKFTSRSIVTEATLGKPDTYRINDHRPKENPLEAYLDTHPHPLVTRPKTTS